MEQLFLTCAKDTPCTSVIGLLIMTISTFYRMFHNEMYITSTVSKERLQSHLDSGWKVLYECTWSGAPL